MVLVALAGATGSGFAETPVAEKPIAEADFSCDDDKSIKGDLLLRTRSISRSAMAGRLSCLQTISGSGARYATADDSLVFWNKGNTAFITEGDAEHPDL